MLRVDDLIMPNFFTRTASYRVNVTTELLPSGTHVPLVAALGRQPVPSIPHYDDLDHHPASFAFTTQENLPVCKQADFWLFQGAMRRTAIANVLHVSSGTSAGDAACTPHRSFGSCVLCLT